MTVLRSSYITSHEHIVLQIFRKIDVKFDISNLKKPTWYDLDNDKCLQNSI